ncbi:hypothetical protein MED297_19772 [Reinekea sp. MED297]|uniref:DUF1839 family protein n=1 Tax=Reinekea blandensis MED297 TaxID=314283 RepID=A4B959_9GAMM|nr:hypothetical protein MED297_19772 [Reinekea sp. MED297] [Reinekea blandensis MED297]
MDVQAYRPHAIHGADRIWAETNCYVDVVLELIHALGFEPIAALPFTLSISYEGDQWTFFKFPPFDLFDLYGLELQELNPWNNLAEHIETQVSLGRPVLVELDSCYLPDTQGTTYRHEHVKSTVAVNFIDRQQKRLGYFHGQSYYELDGDDFDLVLQTEGLVHERMLPPYIELVKCHRTAEEANAALVERSIDALRRQLRYLPASNPFSSFAVQFEKQLPDIKAKGLEHFHQYSFATLRQFGACYELSATYLKWLTEKTSKDFSLAEQNFLDISQGAKTLQFQLARAVARNRDIDLRPLQVMAELWQQAIDSIKTQVAAL